MATKTEAELWQEFEQYTLNQEEKADVSVGRRDKRGNLFILGGHKANIWRLKDGLYSVSGERVPSSQEAIEIYNRYNGTNLPTSYVIDVFNPWYAKQFVEVTKVPSATSDREYTIIRNPDGKLMCECKGFLFRNSCWHIQAVMQAEQEAK